MDPSYNLASKDDIWRLQNDMKSVYAVQAEHADRLSRLERRYDDEGRVKSVWGTTSSAPSVRAGTPHQEPGYNPAAEAFRNFDQDNSSSLLGGLHIEADEEPRRGTSRANSVRFDVSALHGQLTHTSRSSSDFFPIRTGSGFGSHPLTERSSSHKSEGRQSSAGVSTHSTALNGLAFDSSQEPAVEPIARPAAALFLLGPCPSIIRCWLGAKFSNDTLRYAAVCTGASRSMITRGLVEDASLSDQITRDKDGEPEAKLQIYFPEATVRQQSLGSASPAPQLPVITVNLAVIETPPDAPSIQLFLGSDMLRSKSADVLFSQDRIVLYDDDQNKVNVPMIRPESSAAFKNLVTTYMTPSALKSIAPLNASRPARSSPVSFAPSSESKPRSRVDWSRARMGRPDNPATASSSQGSPQLKEADSQSAAPTTISSESSRLGPQATTGNDTDDSVVGSTPVTPGPSDPDESWSGTWRRSSSGSAIKPALREHVPAATGTSSSTFSSVASNAGAQRGSGLPGRGMKVLKTRRMSSTHSAVMIDSSPRPEPVTPGWGQPAASPLLDTSAARADRGVPSTDSRTPTRPSNPVGGASAFGWLNSGSR